MQWDGIGAGNIKDAGKVYVKWPGMWVGAVWVGDEGVKQRRLAAFMKVFSVTDIALEDLHMSFRLLLPKSPWS